MKNWVFNCKESYKARDAFESLGEIDWDLNYSPCKRYNYDVQTQDIVYIRESKPISTITIETEVIDILEVVDNTNHIIKSLSTGAVTVLVDDTSYGGSFTGIKKSDRYARLRILKILNKNGINQLKDHELILKGIIKKGFFEGKRSLEKQPLLESKIKSVFSHAGNTVCRLIESTDISILLSSKDPTTIGSLVEKYTNSTPNVKEVVSEYIEKGSLSDLIKKHNHHECLICKATGSNPIPFYKKDGSPYIEVHHIEFSSTLNLGVNNASNLITVCPNHHRQIHYGDVKLTQNAATAAVYNINGKDITILK